MVQAVRTRSQMMTLQLTAELIGRVSGRSISLEEAKEWTVQEFIYLHYQVRPTSCFHFHVKRQVAILVSSIIDSELNGTDNFGWH